MFTIYSSFWTEYACHTGLLFGKKILPSSPPPLPTLGRLGMHLGTPLTYPPLALCFQDRPSSFCPISFAFHISVKGLFISQKLLLSGKISWVNSGEGHWPKSFTARQYLHLNIQPKCCLSMCGIQRKKNVIRQLL